jgi:hypothetical protein
MGDTGRTIWKFPLKITDKQVLRIPRVHELLDVQLQDGQPMLWAMVHPDSTVQGLAIYCYGTGNPGPSPEEVYVATIQLYGFVWHFYSEAR